jgi:hypothetical protein
MSIGLLAMTWRSKLRTRAIVLSALLVAMLLASSSAAAKQSAQVRFLHAVPGVGTASLSASGVEVGGAGFGEKTGFATVPAGASALVLHAPDGLVLKGSEQLDAGHAYTIIALAKGKSAELRGFADGAARAGVARVRMIQAAPELGMPNFVVGGKVIAKSAPYGMDTGYADFEPGSYKVMVENPANGKTVIPTATVSVAAGSATTAVLVGSRGEKARWVLIDDATAAPTAAPQTGLGGLTTSSDGRPPWLLAALAALGAGALGGLVYRSAARGSGRNGRI